MLAAAMCYFAISMFRLDYSQVNCGILADTLVKACVHTMIRIIVIFRTFEATSCIVIVPIISRWMGVSTYGKVVAAKQGLSLEIDSRNLSVSVGGEGDELFARNVCIYI